MIRRIIMVGAASVALTACGQTVQSGVQVRTVSVPTPVPCVDRADIPAKTPKATLTGNARADTALLKAETLDLRAENGELRALIDPGCLVVEDGAAPEGQR